MKGIFAVLFFGIITAGTVRAQEAYNDQDLKTYAIIELAKTSITSTISPMVNGLIDKQEGMDGNRFRKLKDTKGDAAKLKAVEAKDWEIQFLDLVNKQIDKKKKAAGNVVKLLAGNALGAKKYKAIKAAIKTDPAVKAKVDGYIATLK